MRVYLPGDVTTMFDWSLRAGLWGLMFGSLLGCLRLVWTTLLEWPLPGGDPLVPRTSPRRIVGRTAIATALLASLLGGWAWVGCPHPASTVLLRRPAARNACPAGAAPMDRENAPQRVFRVRVED
jgi:hypothetical protein